MIAPSAITDTDAATSDRISQAREQAYVILRRLGIVLIGLFVFDVVGMSFAMSRHQGYSLDFLPLVGGTILIRGGLKPVRTIRFSAGAGMVGIFIGTIRALWVPVQLIVTELHLGDYARLETFAIGCVWALVALAIFRGACSEPVEIALQAEFGAPRWWTNPALGPLAGLVISILFVIPALFNRPNLDAALAATRLRYGDAYQYAVTGWGAQNDDWKVDVDAYNTEAIKKVQVDVAFGHVRSITPLP
ncbi:MAG TPA: hypothetical protein VEV38_00850 [Candidatus Eremiobacteraceae bacterium]|nr:hypothetical protein [Candidatus Eremiobacteraceae bacterium]